MKKYFSIVVLFIVFMMVTSLTLIGCQRPARPNPNPPNNPNNLNGNNPNDLTRPETDLGNDVAERANYLANAVERIDGVDRAAVVITNNTALVGIDLKDNVEGNMTTQMKNEVERVVRNTDRRIVNVQVTADADLYRRINNIARDINNGRPIQGFDDEIREIIRRITPNM